MKISLNMWYIIAIINSALAGILVKYYVSYSCSTYLYAAIFCNIFVIFAYVQIFKNLDISSSYPFIKILSIMIVAIIGFIFFNEKCNITKIVGIILGVVSIYLLSIKNEN